MEINKNKLALSASATVAIAYIVCAVFTFLWPDFAVKLLGFVFHILNMDKLAGGVDITLGSALVGLLQVIVYTFINVWIFAWIYNRISQPKI